MANYLLSVHNVVGEVREPMTEEEMAQFGERIGALEEEGTSADAPWSSPAVCANPTRPPWCVCRAVRF